MRKYKYKGTTADLVLDIEPEFFNECLYVGMQGENARHQIVQVDQWLPYEEIQNLIDYLQKCQEEMKKYYSKKEPK